MKLNGISTIKIASPEPKAEGQPAVEPSTLDPRPSTGLHLRAFHPTDLRPLVEALRADDAEMVLPTHVLERDGRIVGYGSAGPVRLIAGWTAPSVDDHVSAAALRMMERAAAATGAKMVVVGCAPDCRFKRLMQDEGYTEGKTVTLYYKKVKA